MGIAVNGTEEDKTDRQNNMALGSLFRLIRAMLETS